MLKFALLQLRDKDLAEDVVQEALTKAYQHAASFKGAAALKTWFFAILKNQIIDLLKYRQRVVTVSEVSDDDNPNVFFDQEGHWDRSRFLRFPHGRYCCGKPLYSWDFCCFRWRNRKR